MTSEQTDSIGFITQSASPTPIELVTADALDDRLQSLTQHQRDSLARQGFHGEAGQFAWLEEDGAASVVAGWDGEDTLGTLGALPMTLPEGEYTIVGAVSDLQLLGWGLGSYQFLRYREPRRAAATLLLPDTADRNAIINTTRAVALCRDLINTPAQDMAPSHLEDEVRAIAATFGATVEVTTGDALLDIRCGAIHAVGRAAADAPRLIDLSWGDPSHPKVTVIGKGVTFDSGGLDIKPSSGMRLMKKDMGGAATAIGLAYLIMAQALPIRLRLLIPAAENAISGNAFRPGDVLQTHKGLTVEIDNTDAEGRLLLCDALSIACEDKPEAIFDYATLTGSARSAVGAEVAAMFSNDDALAESVAAAAQRSDDPVWRMPLHAAYNYMLESKIADLVNSPASPYAGAVTAALFLQRFVDDTPWMHFDIMAFNIRSRPAHPEGGEAMALRAVFDHLKQTYGSG
ncbi:MAG: leucyl aminopeptidase family protein [Halieaceae bacterium]|jgi:leucyl aminopeptidase|nr:leucyl aminopeptidase family protein [Halieaceae bacterium]